MSAFLDKAGLYRKMEEFRTEYGFTGPARPFELAERLGIKVSLYEFDSRRFSGALLRGKRHSEVIVSAARSEEGRRFTVAHELVHWYLHSGASFWCSSSRPSALEWQANAGAAELLMPYRLVLPFLKNIRSVLISDRARAARLLAREFSVSPKTAELRLADLSGELEQYLSGVPLDEVAVSTRRGAPPPTLSIDL